MPVLSTELRNKLEKVVVEARDVAEAGARVALESRAVHHYEPYPHMDDEQRKLRNRLRARGRQLGDVQEGARLEIRHLIGEVAYEHWHRMLFAQFLAENNLLIEPEMGIAITMEECEELAREAGEDPRAMAARFAQVSLPQIFREGDPVLELALPPETQQSLDQLLDSLLPEIFTADDSLGWTYQFWQSKRKKEVNESGNKIGADELPAVTQLFTEHYMVQFLYHNTIGAWHAGKLLAAYPELAKTAQSEQELRDAVRLKSQGGYNFEYLRFVRERDGDWLKRRAKPGDVPVPDVPEQSDVASEPLTGPWRPAAGTFDGWPKIAKEITVLDPCCGSGHFLNEGLQLLVRLRMDEEGLELREAIRGALTDNLHGLEIDPRCTQIAAFNVALAAWKLAAKPIVLPQLHIACSGLAVGATKGKWVSLAGDDPRLRAGMEQLYDLFEQAPVLGSLIDPKGLAANLLVADFAELQPLLEKALENERSDDEKFERAVAARGMAKAAQLLSGEYELVTSNVPYVTRGNQSNSLTAFADNQYRESRADLATMFIERMLGCVRHHSAIAVVSPQSWLFQASYKKFRRKLLERRTLNLVARLGPGAFETISGHVVNVASSVISVSKPNEASMMAGIDASIGAAPVDKAALLRGEPADGQDGEEMGGAVVVLAQAAQLVNPDARISLSHLSAGRQVGSARLSDFASTLHGQNASDNSVFNRSFWEVPLFAEAWRPYQLASKEDSAYGGRSQIVLWENENGRMARLAESVRHLNHKAQQWRSGKPNWGKDGVAVSLVGKMKHTLYSGDIYGVSCGVIIPNDFADLPAIWEFVSSGELETQLRLLDPSLAVQAKTLLAVQFNHASWARIAAEKYPSGLPEPQSDDPSQWLFHGHPAKAESATVLQVAVARLLGYRWPPELDLEMRLSEEARKWVSRCDDLLEYADEDGIVCIPSIRGEPPAAERLRALLAAAFGDDWTGEKERELIAETGSKANDLDGWLRNDFFEQHCKLFHHRPFVWHIWDGRTRDGFHALVNYHKLSEGSGVGRRTLENLTYSYLRDWITRQEDGVRRGTAGAEDRLAAALELRERLVAILEGEPPFDLFIRWKSLAEQPIGWDPDINDGVRLNARPFLASDIPGGKKGAGIFRWKPNIKWGKDRGKEPQSLRPKDSFPWFWTWDEQTQDFLGNDKFDGNRWNDLHFTNEVKRQARSPMIRGGN